MSRKKQEPIQLPLEGLIIEDKPENTNGKVVENKMSVKRATFKGGQVVPVHRWFRLTPSFGPELVDEMLNSMDCDDDGVVLDPFSGAGTTLIRCQVNGLQSYGFEINPLLFFVCNTCVNWNLDVAELEIILDLIKNKFYEYKKVYSEKSLDNGGLTVPPIHDPYRWWRKDVLTDLLILKLAVSEICIKRTVKDFFTLTVAGILVPNLTNVTLGRLQLHFIDRSKDDLDVWETFHDHAKVMINDLIDVKSNWNGTQSHVYHINSTDLSTQSLPHLVNYVVTSPPYPNRYSYVWNTRPHLYMFDFFGTPKEASELDKNTIGGTWGTATSILQKGIIQPKYSIISDVISPLTNQIRNEKGDNLMANYVMNYFNMLATQIIEMDKLLAPNAKVAYVVGCSRVKEIFIETDTLLGEIFEGLKLNYRTRAVERVRRRHSDKDLHEGIVYAEKFC